MHGLRHRLRAQQALHCICIRASALPKVSDISNRSPAIEAHIVDTDSISSNISRMT